jgi:hypothetical protein
MTTPTAGVPRSVALAEELRGHIAAVLDLNGVSLSRTLELIKSRVNGATSDQLFAAAVACAPG